jgi:LysR family D-serine deaminase transcriptional activator
VLNLPPGIGSQLNSSQFANLYTFLVAARHLSFSRAADELCLTASAVSHRIGRLEVALSLKLFERLTRQVRLTPDGARIFDILQSAMTELSEALQHSAQTEIAGSIVLYARPSIAQCWLVPRLADFAQQHPSVSVNLRVGNDNVDFRARTVDLALYYANGDFPGLSSRKLLTERMAPVCSPEYARKFDLHDKPENLRSCTLLHDSLAWDNAAYDAEWRLWASRHGMTELLPARSLTFDRSDLGITAAAHHAGIAIGREQLVREKLNSGKLILPFGGFERSGNYDYYIVHPPLDPMPRRLHAFIDWLQACAAESELANRAF